MYDTLSASIWIGLYRLVLATPSSIQSSSIARSHITLKTIIRTSVSTVIIVIVCIQHHIDLFCEQTFCYLPLFWNTKLIESLVLIGLLLTIFSSCVITMIASSVLQLSLSRSAIKVNSSVLFSSIGITWGNLWKIWVFIFILILMPLFYLCSCHVSFFLDCCLYFSTIQLCTVPKGAQDSPN